MRSVIYEGDKGMDVSVLGASASSKLARPCHPESCLGVSPNRSCEGLVTAAALGVVGLVLLFSVCACKMAGMAKAKTSTAFTNKASPLCLWVCHGSTQRFVDTLVARARAGR